jgi:hypothetical protein
LTVLIIRQPAWERQSIDLCQKCQEFAGRISKTGNITEEEK